MKLKYEELTLGHIEDNKKMIFICNGDSKEITMKVED